MYKHPVRKRDSGVMNKKSAELRTWFRQDRLIYWILLLALALRFGALFRYGISYLNLKSDDAGYTLSAIRFLQLGRITYHSPDIPTVHMMPGITLLLAAVFAVFGWASLGIHAAKIVMILIGTAGIWGIYLIGKRVWNTSVGLIAATLATLYVPGILTDNLLLTETPFATAFIFLVYFTIQLASDRKARSFCLVVLFYLVALMFRPTVALFPVLILIYLLVKKYPLQRLWKQAVIAGIVVCAVLAPWWVRNENYYHKFIPLDGGSGDPLLLGTFQGKGYPSDQAYKQIVQQLYATHPNIDAYNLSNLEQQAATDRMKRWWNSDKKSFLVSYLVRKPMILWRDPFYWMPIFHVKLGLLRYCQRIVVVLGVVGLCLSLWRSSRRRPETLLIVGLLLYYTALYSWYFAYSRYSEPLMPFIFLAIGAGAFALRSREKQT
jgi:hypothetical protein